MLTHAGDADTFTNVPDDMHIYVRIDYPFDTFGGRKVTKILLPPLPLSHTAFQHCNKQRTFFLISLINLICLS